MIEIPPSGESATGPDLLQTTGEARYKIDFNRSVKGGMGAVFKGFDRRLNLPVVAKTYRDDYRDVRPDAPELLVAEAQITANLHHKNLPTIYDVQIGPDGKPYFVMDDLTEKGYENLGKVKCTDLDVEDISVITKELTEVLTYLHQQGIHHRDLKVKNIFYRKDAPNGIHVKLIDFGISNAIFPFNPEEQVVRGSPEYMSPEALRNKQLTEQSDIYTLSLIIQNLISNRSVQSGLQLSEIFENNSKNIQYKVTETSNPTIYTRLREWHIHPDPVIEQLNIAMNNNPTNRQPSLMKFGENMILVLKNQSVQSDKKKANFYLSPRNLLRRFLSKQ